MLTNPSINSLILNCGSLVVMGRSVGINVSPMTFSPFGELLSHLTFSLLIITYRSEAMERLAKYVTLEKRSNKGRPL